MMYTFNPIDHPICFLTPDRVDVPSAWYEHIPFAYYLTEIAKPKCFVELGTHNGVSYLAFCQAIQALSLETKSFAIDSWEGDGMTGPYGQEVFEGLRAFHSSRYEKFSNLLKMTFDDGADYFSDASIDLLHIDGFHTYEAVKHDFEHWLPKLTPNAIVIFHDTNVHENDFGVWRYWEELKKKYVSFEFYHGHGLGVLTLADNFPNGLEITEDYRNFSKFRSFFAILGQKHLFENAIANNNYEKGVLHENINSLNQSNFALRDSHEKLEAELTTKEKNIISLQHMLEQKTKEFTQQMDAIDVTNKSEIQKISNEKTQLEIELNASISKNIEMEQVINFTNHELVEYTNSTSWKITRPLRQLKKLWTKDA